MNTRDANVDLLRRLAEGGIDSVVIGGFAAVLHGSTEPTEDVDVCTTLDDQNLRRIADALAPLAPRFRYQPGRHMDGTTSLGRIDAHANVPSVGGFADAMRESIAMDVGGLTVNVLGVGAVIRSKRASGREKDARIADELERLHASP